MHSRILAQRDTEASGKIVEAAAALAQKFDIAPEFVEALSVDSRDENLKAMQQREAVAALLEQITQSDVFTQAEVDAEVDARLEAALEKAGIENAAALQTAHESAQATIDGLVAEKETLVEQNADLQTQLGQTSADRDALAKQVSELTDYSARNNSPAEIAGGDMPLSVSQDGPGQDVTTVATALPADFPKRDALIAAGLDTVEKVAAQTVDQLAAINGLTATTADKVKQAAVAATGQAG